MCAAIHLDRNDSVLSLLWVEIKRGCKRKHVRWSERYFVTKKPKKYNLLLHNKSVCVALWDFYCRSQLFVTVYPSSNKGLNSQKTARFKNVSKKSKIQFTNDLFLALKGTCKNDRICFLTTHSQELIPGINGWTEYPEIAQPSVHPQMCVGRALKI